MYKKILSAFIIYVVLLNFITFLTTFNPKALVNPFHIKYRSISVYYLVKHVVLVSGVAFHKTDKEVVYELARKMGYKYGVDPELIKIVIDTESEYRPYAISRAGAMGLMQVMPFTFEDMKMKDPFEKVQNIEAGVKYLSIQLRRFKSLELALAAYNAGPNKVIKSGYKVPAIGETIHYVNRIVPRYKKVRGIDDNENGCIIATTPGNNHQKKPR